MPHDAKAIANEFIWRGVQTGRPVTPLAVIKLVYFSHAWMLALHDHELVDDNVEAWKYGPVIPSVYHALKHHGWRPVVERIRGVRRPDYTSKEVDIIEQVWQKYGKFSGVYLSALTHAPDAPWSKNWNPTEKNTLIPDEQIKDYYAKQAHKRRRSAPGRIHRTDS